MTIDPKKPPRYITITDPIPYKYGNSFSTALYTRTFFFFGFSSDNKVKAIFQRQVRDWKTKNSIFFADNYYSRILVDLPFQRLTLKAAQEKKYINIENGDITFPTRTYQKIDKTSLSNDLAKEMLLTLVLGLTKNILDLVYPENNFSIALKCAVLIGLIKGIVKTISDTIANKKNSLLSFPWKCSIEIFSEVATEITMSLSNLPTYLTLQSALKGFWRHLYEQIAGGTYFLLTFTELFLEVIKPEFRLMS